MTTNDLRAAAHCIVVPGRGPTCSEATSLAHLRQPLARGFVGTRQSGGAASTAAAGGSFSITKRACVTSVRPMPVWRTLLRSRPLRAREGCWR
jgi:hypothetical protein